MYNHFIPVSTYLVNAPGLSAYRLKIYNLLIFRSSHGRRPAFGGRISISKKLGCSQRTARLALAWLEAQGGLIKTWQSYGGRGKANIYRVIIAGAKAGKAIVAGLIAKLGTGVPTMLNSISKREEKIALTDQELEENSNLPPPEHPKSGKEWLAKIKFNLKNS